MIKDEFILEKIQFHNTALSPNIFTEQKNERH